MNSTITKTAFFDASPETVWEYLTDKDKLAQWFHPAKNSLQENSEYGLYEKDKIDTKNPIIWGKVITMDKPNTLVYTFCIKPFNSKETTVSWHLEACNGGTRLTLTHEGVAEAVTTPLPLLQSLDKGWDEHLAKLRLAA